MSSSQKEPNRQRQGRSRNSPYSRDSTKSEDINELRIQAIENRAKESNASSEEEIEFQTLLDRINKLINKTEFDINNGEYIYKEHCNELRRQVQLAKETQIQQIEEIADKLLNEIDKFEKKSLEAVSKVNQEQLVNKLNEMKLENEKWNKQLDKYKFSNELLDKARESLSKIAFERDNNSSLLHNEMMKFTEFKDQNFVLGELTEVSLDSFSEISLEDHFVELEDKFIRQYNRYQKFSYCNKEFELNFEFKSGKILSNGDLLLYGEVSDQFENEYGDVLLVFDLKRNILKTSKILNNSCDLVVFSSDKICINYRFRKIHRSQQDFDDSEEYEVETTVDKDHVYVTLILNEKLEKLHRYFSCYKRIIGGNESFLFFTNDRDHIDTQVSIYNWSMEPVKEH